MHYIGFTRATPLRLMRLFGKIIGAFYNFYLVRIKIAANFIC